MIPMELHWYTSLPTVHKQSFFSASSITSVISYLLVLAIQTGMRWYLLCFWSAFPLLISDAEHLVIYLLIIYMSYLWENVYSLKMEHTLCLLYSNIWNSVVYLYINNKLSESGIKKAIPFAIASQKDKTLRGRSQDGGGVGRGEHFLPHNFIKRAFKHRVNSTKQLPNAGRGHQAPRKAAQLCERR